MTTPSCQTDVVAFLGDPDTHGVASVETRETHASWLFLAGETAYKLKKAVTFPYLDYSRLEDRRFYCEKEVTLNRRTAPELYLGIIPVTREADGALALDGTGPAVDWLVKMRRFDDSLLLNGLLQNGEIGRRDMEILAEAVARFHQDADPAPDHGTPGAIEALIAGNDAAFAQVATTFTPSDRGQALGTTQRAWLARLTSLIAHRCAEGRVRRCHGDLHLANIVRLNGHPILFDAIEFRDDIPSIDVLYDWAFLLMDLEEHDRPDLAALANSHYLAFTEDFEGLALYPLFLSLRAAIRSHIAANTDQPDAARRYLRMAEAYLDPPRPRLVAFGGLSGSGKSRAARTAAGDLAPAPGAVVVRSDVVRKRLWGVSPLDRLPEDAYSPEMTRRTYDTLMAQARRIVEAGHSAIVDAVFADPQERATVADVAARAGVPFQGVWLEAPADVMRERVRTRQANASDAGEAVLERQLAYDLGPLAWTRVDSNGTKAHTQDKVRTALGVQDRAGLGTTES